MCGIAGIVFLEREKQVLPTVLKRMTDSISHRGPDDEGFYYQNNVGLGFRRLSIIDLKTGHQPLSNADNNTFIVFNGEIYNYLEQRELLIRKGYKFKTATDTEVILYLYAEYGLDCLNYLRGMFAFAIWDNRKQRLFCARDRFGIKPFYYYYDNEKFIFGSEIKAITEADGIDKSLSFEALDSYFAFGYITSDLSIFKNIKKLQPGHFLTLSFNNGVSFEIKRYWEMHFSPDYSKTEKQWTEELEASLSETVKMHMISDVSLGAFLSGGIDSSSVVALMAKNSNMPINTFSIGFKEKKFNELEYARELAKMYNCNHHEQIIEPESINLLPRLVRAYDEPFADTSTIPTYYVSKLAREYVTVALSGDGGDELFAGYDIYKFFNRLHSFPLYFKSMQLNKIIWGNIYNMSHVKGKLKNATYYLSRNKDLVPAYSHIWSIAERQMLISYDREIKLPESLSELFKEGVLKESDSRDFISNMQYLDLHTYLVDDILTKVDRASMMNSLEARVPLLDHKVAEITFRMPSGLKLNAKAQKYIFKKTMSKYVTNNILTHKKQGFSVPLSIWFRDDLEEYTKDCLLARDPLYSKFLNKNFVRQIVESNNGKLRDRSHQLWSLLFFEEWLRQNSI